LNGKPPNTVIFFLDRTHGQRMRKLLTGVGFNVVHHDHYFGREEKDPVWLARCGSENWVVLSGDKSIERVPENRQAAIDAGCKVLFFRDTNSRVEEWAAAVIVGRQRLFEIIERNNGPFFVTIDKQARGHISPVRFAGKGGPKPVQPQPVSTPIAESKTAEPPPTLQPRQASLFAKS
jgi:hypothetical protein